MSALNALFEAQKLAFSPFVFQTVVCMHRFDIFKVIFETEEGLTMGEIARKTNVSEYGIQVLLEMANLAEITNETETGKIKLSKLGYFLYRDEMTKANLFFTQDVCYAGLFNLKESIENGKPEGLKALGNWNTVYEGLSQLPENVKKSWFDFDHFYSDTSFDEALEIVFKNKPKTIFDIGGNTGKWALASANFDPNVRVQIFDLPGQIMVAKSNIEKQASVQSRVHFHEINILDAATEIPAGADVYWMSQFLDCFSESEIEGILRKIKKNMSENASIFIMETFIDNQKFPAAAFSLAATSLYFTAIANGNSKMYTTSAFKYIIEKAGFDCVNEFNLHQTSYHTILELKLKK